MKDKNFYILVAIISLIGIIVTGCLVKYTLNLSSKSSITAVISNEE